MPGGTPAGGRRSAPGTPRAARPSAVPPAPPEPASAVPPQPPERPPHQEITFPGVRVEAAVEQAGRRLHVKAGRPSNATRVRLLAEQRDSPAALAAARAL
eukprot:9337590-Alexandrium_andersonii.AAC.1